MGLDDRLDTEDEEEDSQKIKPRFVALYALIYLTPWG